jgi:acetyl esterase
VSCIPDALVLYNPVIDNGPGGYGYDRVGEEYRSFSPLHNIRSGAPPTIFFLGTEDKLIPVETARYYKKVMEIVGSRCDLKISEGEAHGFFNYSMPDNYRKTVLETDEFLQSLGYLGKEPKINIE